MCRELVQEITCVKTQHTVMCTGVWSDYCEEYLQGGDAQEAIIRVRAMINEKRSRGHLDDSEFPFRVYAFGAPLELGKENFLGCFHVHLLNDFVVVIQS